MMFEDVFMSDVAFAYALAAMATWFLMFGTIFYRGLLRKKGEASQFIGASLVSLLVAAAWPLAAFILIVAMPFYVKDHWGR
jgi:hypothetical protein